MRILVCFVWMYMVGFTGYSQKIGIAPDFSKVKLTTVLEDSISIRAIEVNDDRIYYAGTDGIYGYLQFELGNEFKIHKTHQSKIDTSDLHFRAIAVTTTDMFLLSIQSPALLYKVRKDNWQVSVVYQEDHANAFYDSMTFWNDKEGIAVGDPTDDCLSIIITRDGGAHWNKLPCNNLPAAMEGEGAFAASNGNIAVVNNHTWIVSGGSQSRVFYSSDKGKSWEVFKTPIIQGTATTGAYSVHFYDQNNGILFGGDYTKPDQKDRNKAVTIDGGSTWKLVAGGKEPGYKSCVRYVPGSDGKRLIAVGFTGISFSGDSGKNWKTLSKEGFYTVRFITDTCAVVAGKNRIAILEF